MKINVIGLGYIGLPTALMLSASGLGVVGTDINNNVIEKLNDRILTFEEEGLKELFEQSIANEISFTNRYIETNKYIITVPTPYDNLTKKINPSYVIDAVKEVLKVCLKNSIVVIESTVSPGTIDKFIRPIIKENGFEIGKDIHIIHAPERIIPGNMINELKNNARTIGCDHIEIGEEVKGWYKCFCNGDIAITDIKTAEMSKVVENTFRDINIAFANELAQICRRENMDVYELIKIANNHPRVSILQPGPGVGGHCISVDPWFLVGDYPDITNLILAARERNDSMPRFVLKRVKEIMKKENISSIDKVGFYGLTYKENIDDIRESPMLQIKGILEESFIEEIKCYDPFVNKEIIKGQYMDFNKFINDIEIMVVLVSHDHLINNLDNISHKKILDTKNIINFDTYKL